MVYYTNDGMDGNRYIYQFIPKNGKYIMSYFSPEAVYCDQPVYAEVFISIEQYMKIMGCACGVELDSVLVLDILNDPTVKDNIMVTDISEIINLIINYEPARYLADQWYTNHSFFDDIGNTSISGYISNKLIEAADKGELNIKGYTDAYDLMDYFTIDQLEKITYSEMLSFIQAYL